MSKVEMGAPVAPSGSTSLVEFPGVEECVRYYPPNLETGIEPEVVFSDAQDTSREREIGIFVDVPFCESICGFCPFNVYPASKADTQAYLDALAGELRILQSLVDFARTKVTTVWIGGGTPSILKEEALSLLLDLLYDNFNLTAVKEFTVEVKPTISALTDAKLKLLFAHRVNRISMGVQSTHEAYLDLLGRGHTANQAIAIVRLLKDAGFELNIDMIYRLPGQTLNQVAADIDSVRALGIDHMSWFPYIPHDGTALAKKLELGHVAPQGDRQAYLTMFNHVTERLAEAGYSQYTPYYFTRSRNCEYHVQRWKMPQSDILGIGAGAFSFFNGWIYTNEHNPQRYKQRINGGRPPVVGGKRLSTNEKITRLAVLGIKFFSLDKKQFERETGVRITEFYANELELLHRLGLIDVNEETIDCTPLGRAFNNDVATVFSTDTARRAKHPQAVDFMRLK